MAVLDDFFWASLFAFTTAGPSEKAQVKKRLTRECQEYCAAESAALLGQSPSRPPEEILTEAKEKCRAILNEVRDTRPTPPPQSSPPKKPTQPKPAPNPRPVGASRPWWKLW